MLRLSILPILLLIVDSSFANDPLKNLGQRTVDPYASSQTNTPQSQGGNQGTLTSGQRPGSQGVQVGEAGQNLSATKGYQVTEAPALGNAQDTSSQGGGTEMLGLAMGAMFGAICVQPKQQWACPLAAMSLADALSSGDSKDGGIATASSLGADPFGSWGDGNGDLDSTGQEQAKAGLERLAGMGYTLNGDGSVNTPNGARLTADDFSSPEALMQRGLSAEQAGQAFQGMQQVQRDAMLQAGLDPDEIDGGGQALMAAGAVGGGSGDGETSGTGGVDKVIEEVEFIGGKKEKKDNRMPASEAAQLSKNFNGTPIGIGMADLFLIVHKKYKEKSNQKDEFITKEY